MAISKTRRFMYFFVKRMWFFGLSLVLALFWFLYQSCVHEHIQFFLKIVLCKIYQKTDCSRPFSQIYVSFAMFWFWFLNILSMATSSFYSKNRFKVNFSGALFWFSLYQSCIHKNQWTFSGFQKYYHLVALVGLCTSSWTKQLAVFLDI